jgi:hypothetical protein
MFKALLWTLVSSLAFGVVGSLLGMVLGWQVPIYFQATYDLRRGLGPDPITLGAWVGFQRGFVGGWIWFLVLSSLHAWSEREAGAGSAGSRESRRDRGWISGVPLMFMWLIFAVFLGLMVFLCGIQIGRSDSIEWTNRSNATRKSRRLSTLLIPSQLTNVEVREATIPEQVRLRGSVPDQAAFDALHDLVTQEFGQGEVDFILREVGVDSPRPDSEQTRE